VVAVAVALRRLENQEVMVEQVAAAKAVIALLLAPVVLTQEVVEAAATLRVK
jgi:hypothetical protein